MKKNMALVMASMMAALSLTACGGSGAASTAAADTKTADTTAAGSTQTPKQHRQTRSVWQAAARNSFLPPAATRVPTMASEASLPVRSAT